jgi:hypothetical protein
MSDWTIKLVSKTHDQSGKRRTFTKTLTYHVVDLKSLVPLLVPSLFHGCEIEVVTPLHRHVGIIDPDTREFRFTA